jgi:tetratricopeptide (TPR) repeat protein
VQQSLPLCDTCRDRFLKLSIPRPLRIGAILIVLVLLYTAIRSPWELAAAIAWDRGQVAWDEKKYAEAESDYKAALNYFPHSTSVLGKVARAAQASGDNAEFGRAMDALAQLNKTDPDAAKEMADILLGEAPPKP